MSCVECYARYGFRRHIVYLNSVIKRRSSDLVKINCLSPRLMTRKVGDVSLILTWLQLQSKTIQATIVSSETIKIFEWYSLHVKTTLRTILTLAPFKASGMLIAICLKSLVWKLPTSTSYLLYTFVLNKLLDLYWCLPSDLAPLTLAAAEAQ